MKCEWWLSGGVEGVTEVSRWLTWLLCFTVVIIVLSHIILFTVPLWAWQLYDIALFYLVFVTHVACGCKIIEIMFCKCEMLHNWRNLPPLVCREETFCHWWVLVLLNHKIYNLYRIWNLCIVHHTAQVWSLPWGLDMAGCWRGCWPAVVHL